MNLLTAKKVFFLLTAIALIAQYGCQKLIETKNMVTDFATTIRSTERVTKLVSEKKDIVDFTEEEAKELIQYGKLALENAQKIDFELLNRLYPELGDKFEDELISGVNLIVKGYEEKNKVMIQEGKSLIEKWGNWFEENIENIKPLSFLKK